MATVKKIRVVFFLLAISLLLASCSPGQIFGPEPTQTPTQTPTPMPTSTPTPTPIPSGSVIGTVYLLDRDEPVQTKIILMRKEGDDDVEVEITETDEMGNYAFIVTEPGDYYVQVSVFDLMESCKNLRSHSTNNDWIVFIQRYGGSGMTDALINSGIYSVFLGQESIINCDLYCD